MVSLQVTDDQDAHTSATVLVEITGMPDQAPFVANDPGHLVLDLDASPYQVDLSEVFGDQDDPASGFTYAITQGPDSAVVNVALQGSLVTVTPVGLGYTQTTIAVTSNGKSATWDWTMRVKRSLGTDAVKEGYWHVSPWMGYYYDLLPFVYLADHGWIYVLVNDADNFIYYDYGLDSWIYTRRAIYDYQSQNSRMLYSWRLGAWLMHHADSAYPQRRFYNYSTGQDVLE